MGAALLLLVVAGVLGVMRSVYADRVYPGVYVESVPVGGTSLAEAKALLQQRAGSVEQGTIAFTYNDQTWTPTLSEVGVTIDLDRSLDRAYEVGREENARDRLFAMGELLRHDRQFPLIMRFDHAVLNAWLDGLDEELGLPPHDAYLTIEGATVEVVPEVDGTITDRAQIQQLIYDAALSLRPVNTSLPVIARVAQVRVADLEPVKARVEEMLSQPVKLTFEDEEWEVDPVVLGGFLTQTYDPEKLGVEALTIAVDETALSKWLNQQFADDVNRAAVDAKVTWDEDKNEVVATSKSKDGYKLKPRTLASRVAASLMGDHAAVEVPVTVVPPKVDSSNLGALGITTKLATGDSNYEGSNEGRSTNIQVGSSLLDGTLVPPHEEFSFNHAIGIIDKEKGYVEAPVIKGERIGRDIGGGICQLSTTVFRAALKGGMPISEWWPHTYRLAFYEQDDWAPGFDASILQPEEDPFSGGDFKFINPTDSWMLVESYTENNRVYVIIYGMDLDYKVSFTKPKLSDPIKPPDEEIEQVDDKLPEGTVEQTEKEQDGIEITYDRTVEDRDGNVIRQDTWTTLFDSRPNVWTVSPDMEGKSPANKNRRNRDAE